MSNKLKSKLSIIICSIATAAVSLIAEENHKGHDHGDYDHEKPIELEPYVTTGTRTARVISESPVKTELILQGDFEDYNLTSFKNALKLIPTARFENDCQNCGVNQIQLLGLSTDYTAILFDGAPLYSGLAKVYGADLFPAIFLDRIEVVKGGSSVLYGPEAMAGVINLITTEPAMSRIDVRFSMESLKGEAMEFEAAVKGDYADPDGLYSLRGYVYSIDREGLDLGSDGFTEIFEYENFVLGAEGWWHPVANSTMQLTYQYMDQAHRGGNRLDLPEEQARVAESLAHQIHMLHWDWTHGVSADFDYQFRVSYVDIERTSFYGARADNAQRAYELEGNAGEVTEAFIANNQALIDAAARQVWGLTENEVYYAEAQFNHYWGRHTVTYGAQYRYEYLEDGSLYDKSAPHTEDDFDNIGFFLQDQWAITDSLELVPGLRVDKHDNVEGSILSPRIAARHFASDSLTLRASWSTGFNAPGAFNEDRHIGVNNGGAIFLVNEPDLEEESSQTWSFGAEFRPDVFDRQVILHSQVHYTLLDGTFEIDDTGELSGDPNTWLRINGPDSTVWVWENNINWQVNGHLRLDAGLSYVNARFDETIDRVTGLSTDEYLKRPEWTGHFALSYENDDLFNVNALFTYTGSMLAVGEDADIWRETPSFFELDLGVSKVFSNLLGEADLILSMGINNIFDERQKDFQDNGEERDPTYMYGPTNPRTYYFSLRAVW